MWLVLEIDPGTEDEIEKIKEQFKDVTEPSFAPASAEDADIQKDQDGKFEEIAF